MKRGKMMAVGLVLIIENKPKNDIKSAKMVFGNRENDLVQGSKEKNENGNFENYIEMYRRSLEF